MTDQQDLKTTPLTALHERLGGKMVPFAGYLMPVQFPLGILGEHKHTRAKAGLFDVSHMGQLRIDGADAAARIETLVPGDIVGLDAGRTRYTQFTNADGGILDDLMVTNAGDHLFVVVNAACKETDTAHLRNTLGDAVTEFGDRALLALQGPAAESVLAALAPEAAAMTFMTFRCMDVAGVPCFVTRSGYTGEDGYEISVPAADAEALAERLLAHPDVEPIGLGARDSLRLEAGLCLYGHDIDTTTSPVEAALTWSIGKRRREQGSFPGAARVQAELANGPSRRRVGLKPEGRAPAREGTEITDPDGRPIGKVTSGGFGPSVDGPVAMGYVETAFAADGTELRLVVRGKPLPARVAKLPFVAPGYKRG
ncbi:MAG: glycine cleavage system aminomethyltransferase GcvT [Thalassobaculum sp.]|uniref:glycine cleavage system aminomethyltransferase GcvT n=1 Tax=Thalassobaculum sp. TaxID=2022740 RepID=UPI0032EE4F91